jgi:hypothetical protein
LIVNRIVDIWKLSLDAKENIIAIFLDLSKAFDTVNHTLLLEKLYYYNFSSNAINLIKHYLSNRFMLTKFGKCFSDAKELVDGVPQGSVLGPLLFIIFLNDIGFLDLESMLALFADDTEISFSHKDLKVLTDTLTRDLIKIENWLSHNRLILNAKKTNGMFISNGKKTNPSFNSIIINLSGAPIPFVQTFRYLGVMVDDKLNFHQHIKKICKQVTYKTNVLKKCAYLFDLKFKTILFKLFIQSQFDYCSTLLFNLNNQSDQEKLETLFSKSLNKFLNIKLYKSLYVLKNGKAKNKNFRLNLSDQIKVLDLYEILPIKLRFFYHFISFIHTNLKYASKFPLCSKIINLRNISKTVRVLPFRFPPYKRNYKFSFTIISIKLLNLFLHNYLMLTKKDFSRKFKNVNYLLNYYNLYIKHLNSWS